MKDRKLISDWTALALLQTFASFIATLFSLIFALFTLVFEILHLKANRKRDEELRQAEIERLGVPLDTELLTKAVDSRFKRALFPEFDDFMDHFADGFISASIKRYRGIPVESILRELYAFVGVLYGREELTSSPLGAVVSGTIEEARYRDHLLEKARKTERPAHTMKLIAETLTSSLFGFLDHLPRSAFTDEEAEDQKPPPHSVPIVDALPNIGKIIFDMVMPFFHPEIADLGLFTQFRKTLVKNQETASAKSARELVNPQDFDGTPQEIVDMYLRHTQLHTLFEASMPFAFDTPSRLEHWHLMARTGHGKTQTLQHIIYNDLISEERPTLIIVDSQGQMLNRIARLKMFEDDPDRLIVIDPAQAPALNIFAPTSGQTEAQIVELYTYIFSALQADLTQKMGTAFQYLVRLTLSVPNATIMTFLQLLEKEKPDDEFNRYVAALGPIDQAFFEKQYFKSFRESRTALAQRIYKLVGDSTFAKMLNTPHNRLDMYVALQDPKGKVILINTSKATLEEEMSRLFGRMMIAQVMSAIYRRALLPEAEERKLAYLIVDEAHEYFGGSDETLSRILQQARKNRLGILFAHHDLEQLKSLRSTVITNTTIKVTGSISDTDARILDGNMRTTEEFLMSMHKHEDHTEYACYIANKTPKAVKITVPFRTMENAPNMTDQCFVQLMEANRQRYASPPQIAAPAIKEPPEPAEPPIKEPPEAPQQPSKPPPGAPEIKRAPRRKKPQVDY